MIKNERQYRITKSWAARFRKNLEVIGANPGEDPRLTKAHRDSLQSELEILEEQIAEYEALRSGKQQELQAHSFEELPQALIKARIAAGITHKQLAERLGLKEQQVQHYEATEYASVSMRRVNEVIQALTSSVNIDLLVNRHTGIENVSDPGSRQPANTD